MTRGVFRTKQSPPGERGCVLHRVEVANDIARNDGVKLVLRDIVAEVRVGTKAVNVREPKERLFIGLCFRQFPTEQVVVAYHGISFHI